MPVVVVIKFERYGDTKITRKKVKIRENWICLFIFATLSSRVYRHDSVSNAAIGHKCENHAFAGWERHILARILCVLFYFGAKAGTREIVRGKKDENNIMSLWY